MKKFFLVDKDYSITQLLTTAGYKEVDDDSADFVVFTGGADVTPALYGEEKQPKTHCSTERDFADIAAYNRFRRIPKVGICRGFQFLSVMAGAVLKQHIDNHAGPQHTLLNLKTGEVFDANSTHHQCVIAPKFQDFTPVAVCPEDGTLESAIFMEAKSFGVQYHPEYYSCPQSAKRIFLSELADFLEKVDARN